MLTRGRCRCAPIEAVVTFDVHEFDVVMADVGSVDGVESSKSC